MTDGPTEMIEAIAETLREHATPQCFSSAGVEPIDGLSRLRTVYIASCKCGWRSDMEPIPYQRRRPSPFVEAHRRHLAEMVYDRTRQLIIADDPLSRLLRDPAPMFRQR